MKAQREGVEAGGRAKGTALLPPGAMLVDSSLRVVGWDSRMERATGLSFEEVRGRPCWLALRGVGQGGSASCKRTCKLARKAFEGGEVETVRMLVPCHGGTCDALVSTSAAWLEGEPAILHLLFSYGQRRSDGSRLTPRQLQVLQLLDAGVSTKAIARELGIAENTARNHVRAVLKALGANTRLLAVHKARRHGLVP